MDHPSEKLALYLNHRAALVDYSTPIVGCRAQAEDVVQEAWLRFCAQPEQHLSQPLGYLYRIVRNLSLDLKRHIQVEAHAPEAEQLLNTLAADSPSPEQHAIQHAQLMRLQSALDQLPPRTQQAFILHRLQAMTFKQIAEQLGISSSLAHQLVRDALVHCARQLDDD